MSIVLIKQYKDDQSEINEKLQKEFSDNGVTTIFVPVDLTVEWLPYIGKEHLAVIHQTTRLGQLSHLQKTNAVEKLKKDLAENDIHAIILPSGASVEVMPV